MAPALTETSPAPPHTLSEPPLVSKAVFPDGLKTSGQWGPIDSRLRNYTDFPKTSTGPTLWSAGTYKNNPERWTHVFSDDEVSELSKAANEFIASGTPLTGLTKNMFPLPTLSSFFGAVRNEIINGKGFVLFRGLPVQQWGLQKCAVSGDSSFSSCRFVYSRRAFVLTQRLVRWYTWV